VTPLVIVMDAGLSPPPAHPPVVVMVAGKPAVVVAATENVAPKPALDGAGVVTVIV
jgi:hypothetical protein